MGSAFGIFQYLLYPALSSRSMTMQFVTERFAETFCKNTVYRFLSATKTNRDRFVLLLSERIISRTIFAWQAYDHSPTLFQAFP